MKAEREVAVVASGGALFHRRIAVGKKEYLWTSTREKGIRKRCWWPLVIAPVGMRRVGGIAMRW